MLRGLEALAIAVVVAVASVAMRFEVWGSTPSHQVTASRAVAWMLLVSDSAPYTGGILEVARSALGDRLAYLEVGGYVYGSPVGGAYAVRAVWLGYNGTVKPVEVVVGVRP